MAGKLFATLDAPPAEEDIDIDIDSAPDQVAAGAEPIGEPQPPWLPRGSNPPRPAP
jgi:hypothetical protein